MMNDISVAVLVLATVSNGLLAGVFFAFSCGVAPGLRRVDDRSYVTAFRAVNQGIVNGRFLLVFFGAPILTIVATALHLDAGGREALPWLVAGLLLDLLCFAVTVAVNVPLNNRLGTARVDGDTQLKQARGRFETRWNQWNHVRTAASIAGSVVLAIGLAAR